MQNYDIFISYETTTGTGYAENLKDALEKCGYKPFLADLSIDKGKDWKNEIDSALENCKYFVVVFTTVALISPEVKKEVKKAIGLEKRIFSCKWKKIKYSETKELSKLQQIEFGDKYELANEVVYELNKINEREKKIAIDRDAEEFFNQGNLFYDLGDFEKAEEQYKRAIQLNQEYTEAHNNLGVLFYNSEKYEKAEEEYREAIRINPEGAEAHYKLGVLLGKLKRYGEAEKEFREAIKINPDYGWAYDNLGLVLSNLNRFDEAEEEHREAIRINPEDAKAHNNLGVLLKNLERYEEAGEEYREAIRINPEYAKAHYNLGVLLGELKRYGDLSFKDV